MKGSTLDWIMFPSSKSGSLIYFIKISNLIYFIHLLRSLIFYFLHSSLLSIVDKNVVGALSTLASQAWGYILRWPQGCNYKVIFTWFVNRCAIYLHWNVASMFLTSSVQTVSSGWNIAICYSYSALLLPLDLLSKWFRHFFYFFHV